MAHLFHLHDVTKVGEQAFISQVDEAPGANLKGKVGALEAVSLNGDLEVVVSLGLPLQGIGMICVNACQCPANW